jgi:lysozyme
MISTEATSILVTRQLQSEESFREFLYDDATGKQVTAPDGHNYTIGIGFNVSAGCPLDLAIIIAEYFVKKADEQLSHDLDWYDKLDDIRKCVLIDLAFNMGVHGVEAFNTTLNLISQGFYKSAADQLRKSKWYSQVTRRAEPLCLELETGIWQKISA